MSHIDIKSLLDRYIKAETSTDENDIVEKWLLDNDVEKKSELILNDSDLELLTDKILFKINVSIDDNEPKIIVMPKRQIWKMVMGIAAVLALFTFIFLEWPILNKPTSDKKETILVAKVSAKKKIILKDGSIIWVNDNSVFKYQAEFSGNTREVYLNGEAFFNIKHDPKKPFIVHTGNITTVVLGTAFNINTDEHKHTVIVTVTRGKVSVNSNGKTLGVIVPNQQLAINTLSLVHSKISVFAYKYVSWTQNLSFDDVTFENAVKQLEDCFGVKIAFANDDIKKCRFSGTVENGERLDKILSVICSFNNSTYQYNKDGSVIINGKGCNSSY